MNILNLGAREGGAGGDADSDAEDEDFIAEKDDAGSPTDDSDEEGSDAGEDGDGESAKEPKRKEPDASKPAVKKKKREEGEDDGKKKKKKKKRKKDPNAPKRAMSSFMYFSRAERERLIKTNPGLPFKEAGKVVGERWKKMTDEEKEPYEAHAKRDKTRYRAEMAEYRSGKGASGPVL